MRIFISWSGEQSHIIANALKGWLPYFFPSAQFFLSSEDIRKGLRWLPVISKELKTTNAGIVCLTPDSLNAPWVLYEAGALSKALNGTALYTFLVGLTIADVQGPLEQFNHTIFEKEDVFMLLKSINDTQPTARQEEGRLRTLFERFWEDLEQQIRTAASVKTAPARKRSNEDMLVQLLEAANIIRKSISAIEERNTESDELLAELLLQGKVDKSPAARNAIELVLAKKGSSPTVPVKAKQANKTGQSAERR